MDFRIRRLVIAVVLGVTSTTVAACDEDDPTDPDPLAQVQNVAVTPTSETAVEVTWNAVSGADQYRIQRGAGLNPATFTTVATQTGSSFDDTGLTPDTDYTYRVAALRDSEVGPYGQASVHTPAQPVLPTVDITADITADRTFYRDTIYRLATFIKVGNGATLTIQDGTRIEGEELSALFVLRGARIEAVGSASNPIVMTSARPEGSRRAGDWGGLILIGNGIINRTGTVILEGTGTSTTNPQQRYDGGTDNTDDSGRLEYVRVEFAGFGPATDQELNSFTFAAVGSGTEMSYLQSLYGLDDSFEWFGGAADAKYLVSYESGDDHFDASEGFVGRVQYAIAFQSVIPQVNPGSGSPSNDPQGVENDGCGDSSGGTCAGGQNSTPFNEPMFANFTLIGAGAGAGIPAGGGYGMVLRRGTGGYYVNHVVARFDKAALSLRDVSTTGQRATDGLLIVRNVYVADTPNLFHVGGSNFTVDETANSLEHEPATTAASLFLALPAAAATGPDDFDWTPAAGSNITTGGTGAFTGTLATRAGTFVTGTTYRGAVEPGGTKWWQGWTNYARD